MNSASSATGPESPVPSGSASPRASSQAGPSHQAHIHFPNEPESPRSKLSGSSNLSGSGLRSLESGSGSLRTPVLKADFPERRRVRSTHVAENSRSTGTFSRSQYLAFGKKSISHSLHSTKAPSSIGSSPLSVGALLPAYVDPDNDDPNILADLHKALQYKPHVEQHLKESKSSIDFAHSSVPSTSSPSNPTLVSSSVAAPSPLSDPNTLMRDDSVDFSPASGKLTVHPVPKSSDDGATLDWSGSATEDEKHDKRWLMSMSLARRSSKEKQMPLSRKALVEKQDVLYSDKLARIKNKSNEVTTRKAEITKDQLRRRYAAFDSTYKSRGGHLNLADVVRWFDKQDDVVKSALLESEPMPWLRHLVQKHGQSLRGISPWSLSAIIIEQYIRSHSDTGMAVSPVSIGDGASDADSSVSVARLRRVSRPTSFGTLDATLARKPDHMLSFEPMAQPRRDSLGTDSRVSVDSQLRRWRQSLLTRRDPDASSEGSMRSRKRNVSAEQGDAQMGQNSSAGPRSPLQALGIKKRSHPTPLTSEEGHSSAGDSMAEQLNLGRESEKENRKSDHEKKRSRFHLSLDMKSAQDGAKRSQPLLSLEDLRTDANPPNKGQSLPVGTGKTIADSTETFDQYSPSNHHLGSPIVLPFSRKADQRRSQGLSPPQVFHTPRTRRARPNSRNEAQNHALHVEYTRKKELLDALVARNQRMRALLQIAARSITDYDETQSSISEKLGLDYSRLPPEVLEALKHDPSVSTGHLRHMKGWRAVEDIHSRREHQKETLQTFTASLSDKVAPLSLPNEGICENAISDLTDLVERLHSQRSAVLSQVKQTHALLSRVKQMRNELKPEFDETSKHTSVNYPELVRLEALHDELVNETNHLWQLAETTLSFLLASVAPLMKAFGRPIWDELHDFLVIPLYRNGFSGEDQWYPVSFPRRNFVHWLRLLLFAVSAPFILFHGTYAFVALLTHGYVIRIPSFIPAFAVYAIFSGMMCFFASILLGLLVTVLCESFIILWWTLWLLHIVR